MTEIVIQYSRFVEVQQRRARIAPELALSTFLLAPIFAAARPERSS